MYESPWGHGDHLFGVNVDGGNPVRSWRWGCLATLCNQFMFGVLPPPWTLPAHSWNPKSYPQVFVSEILQRHPLPPYPFRINRSTLIPQHPSSHSLLLDWNRFLQSMEEFLLYTFYPSKSFIYILKPIHSSNVLINAFFWDVSFLGSEH